MGRESKLRNNSKPESKYAHSNGDRKLYDRDAMPEGLDSDIWDLTLHFEQRAENYGVLTPGRPIVYTELYNRISKDPDLSKLLRSGGVQYAGAHTDGSTDDTIVSILKEMIDIFFDCGMYDYDKHMINTFTARINFDYIKRDVIDSRKIKILKETTELVSQQDREIKPSRRSEEQKVTYKIMNAPRTEDETKEKIEHWKSLSR